MASNKAIATMLGLLVEAFPTREVTKRTAQTWETILSGVDDEILHKAALHLCRDPERKFFPTTGEVFAAIRSVTPRPAPPRLVPSTEGLYESRMLRLPASNTPTPLAETVSNLTSNLKEDSAA